jgi:uncharacterized membrane protein
MCVIPGVAIATALMPPLCTAGYGIATWQWNFFFGAFYLFTINTVFIALATFLTIRFLKFPFVNFLDKKSEARARHSITAIIILTLIPSIYLGYIMVQENRFEKNVTEFIEKEGRFENDFLLKKVIDPAKRTVVLTYFGDGITESEIKSLQKKLAESGFSKTELTIVQGFAWLKEENKLNENLKSVLSSTSVELKKATKELDSIRQVKDFNGQSISELQVLYPTLKNAAITRTYSQPSSADSIILLAVLSFSKPVSKIDKQRIADWLKVKYKEENVKVVVE